MINRACTLIFDEVSLKRNLQYDSKQDLVHGYADTGYERRNNVANTALLVLVSGIAKKWIQPVAFMTGEAGVHSGPLLILKRLIRDLKEFGLFVKALICDQGGSNGVVAKTLGISPERPFFTIDGMKVYFIFDPPHLLKCTRNNLQKRNLKIGTKVVSWEHIKQLYVSTHHLKLKYVPKLTDRHINETPFGNMKVKYAAQVFSRSVCLAMQVNELLPTAVDTAEFVERMDVLFDTANSSCVRIRERKMRHAMSPSTEHVQFLNSCFSWFQSWKFESGCQPRTVRGWQVAVRAIVLLWAELQASFGFQCLLTCNLNQDPLENLFGIVRQQHGCNETPNAYQFAAGLKHIVVGKLFKLPNNSNCEQDKSVLLKSLKRPPLSDVAGQSQSTAGTSLDVREHLSVTDLPSLDVLEANIVFYMSGYLVHAFLKSKACYSC
ncbi:hypothetical protein HPB48_005070 [Haemaphysalis longicornis]|uniref:Transposase n=1 Tax=Haemaphysalis longicornis TaxID=44386 RepID=A0A9J6FHD6_HAELO|nr:hypothetical protein HPB48_005070 [Haemaphysalis longicornis]